MSPIKLTIENRLAAILATCLSKAGLNAVADAFRHRGRTFRGQCCLVHRGVQLSLALLAAPTTASVAQEQPLICYGNEPFWSLDLTEPAKARFSTPDAPAVDYVGAANTLAHRKESVWRGQATVPDAGDLVAFLRSGACSDGMSDTVHPYSVSVSLADGRDYAGCCRVSEAPVVSATLENAVWRLTALPGQTLPADQARRAVTVSFEAGRVHGFSGCNQFTGSYTVDNARLVVGMLGGTMMACPEPAMSVESQFLRSFAGALDVTVAGNDLTLTQPNGGDALRFEREVPSRLEGAQWEVTGYNNGRQAVVSPKVGTRLTLMFQDGQVSGDSGCNRFHGSFAVEGSALTIHPLAITRKACEDAVMTQEQEFLSALASATTWDIAQGMLDVHRADGERVLTASADDEFYGIIESRPDGTAGTWIIGGRAIEATEDTDLDEDDGPLKIGACAEVDMDDGKVEEIETKSLDKCGQ